MKTQSSAYEFIEFMWHHNGTESWMRLNCIMHDTVNLAINAGLKFHEDDIMNIQKSMSGGHWFGCNSNGKGYGESFYTNAVLARNMSAIKSYEKYEGLKPFISTEGNRARSGSRYRNKDHRYRVTGFDFESHKIYLVAYALMDFEEKGTKRLLSFDNKEWLSFRKTINEF